ncbi:MAG: hypothetical protein ABJL99_12270 [Aliishimia sp.]
MADDGKKNFSIDVTINPFGECKGSKVPEWFKARPKLMSIVKDIQIKRSMMLDDRKWKKKVLEDGVYAVAKYDLALFSTALTSMQKDIDKAIDPKAKKNKKFKSNDKTETKEEGAALSTAEKKVTALWKKVSKSINDKVSLALDEVESDKGDNKKAIAVGKQALKVFNGFDTKELFALPIAEVTGILDNLASNVTNAKGDTDPYFKDALTDMRAVESDYDLIAKSTSKVAKMFIALGEKMAKDKGADKELIKFGESIAKGNIKSDLQTLSKDISGMGKDIDALVNFLAKGDTDVKNVKSKASKFKGEHNKKKGTATAILAEMRKLATEFKKIEKKLK